MKTIVKGVIRDEKGYVLNLVLILLVVGGLILTPLLGLMSTGLMSGQVYENTMSLLYAADAGIEDGLWRIKNVELADPFPDYDEYDYYGQWGYDLGDHVNDKDVSVTIENVWIPMGIDPPDSVTANQTIQEGKLIIAGNPSGTSEYVIKISYDPCGDAANAYVLTMGIWLPPGFEYDNNCSLEGEVYYSELDVTSHKGGYAVVWDFVPSVLVKDFPDTVTFQYSGPEKQTPAAAVSWIEIDAAPYYTWDADVIVYKIISTATDPVTGRQTAIESYTSNVEPRKLGSAIAGDYTAIGATLMTPEGGPVTDYHYRDVLFEESSATVQSTEPESPGYIPPSAYVDAAWLYWSGWIEEGPEELTIFQEDCSDFDAPQMDWDWTTDSAWDIYNWEFMGNAYHEESSGEKIRIWGPEGPETCDDFVYPIMNWDAESAWNIYSTYYGSEFRGNAYYDPAGEWLRIWGPENCQDFVYAPMNWDADSAWEIYNGEFRGNAYYDPSGEWQVIWGPETCEQPTVSWDYGSAWDCYSGEFRGNAYGLGEPGGEWQVIWSDDCSDFADWDNGSAWDISSGRFRGDADWGEPEAGKYLPMSASIDLSAHAGKTVVISWWQDEDYADDDDCLRFQLSANGGANWGPLNTAFCGGIGSGGETLPPYEIPQEYLTSSFMIMFYLDGFSGWSEYCDIDNIEISVFVEPPSDPRYLTMSDSIDLSTYAGQTVEVSWQQHESGELESEDCLHFDFYNGTTWINQPSPAFCNDIGSTPQERTYTIPASYLTGGSFKMRFYLDGFSGTNWWGNPDEYCYIDDIEISVLDVTPPPGSYLTMSSSIALSAYAGETVRISWQQHESGDLESSDCLYVDFSPDNGTTWITQPEPAFCNDIGSTPQERTYTIPASYLTGGSFKMRFYLDGFSGTNWWGNPDEYCYIDNIQISVFDVAPPPGGYLTMSDSIDLSAYTGQTVEVSWQQHEAGSLESSDCLRVDFSPDDGTTWTTQPEPAFCGNIGSTPVARTYTIPASYLTGGSFKMRFYLDGFTSSSEYCYIDNIEISAFVVPPHEPLERHLAMSDSIDLSAYAGQTVEVSWQQHESGDLSSYSDCLYFAFSGDGGTTWSTDIEAFCGDIGSTPVARTYTIPASYLTGGSFKMRFYLSGFDDNTNQRCYIDNIKISAVVSAVESAKVNRVIFNGKPITADPDDCQVKPTRDASGAPNSWSYSCFCDVTNFDLGGSFSVKALIEDEMHSGGSGSLTFNLEHWLEDGEKVYQLYDSNGSPAGTTGYPLATPAKSTSTQYHWTYAGWSLLVIYSSPETKGHQLYLFDDFRYVGQYETLPFAIEGFLCPAVIEPGSSHLTYFVGEGDDHWSGDYIEVNGYRLSGPGNPSDNIFNSYSNAIPNLTYKSGIDIDTFDMTNCIGPGDSSADVMLGTGIEIYNLVYIILSFHSLVTHGGVMGYLIK